MTSSKSTKRALVSSALAIIMCVAMLIGTTFAWFTDTASTAVNKIQAGKLDVALEMKDTTGNWVSAEGKTLSFLQMQADGSKAQNPNILWEPGCTYELPELRVVNNGNLALKYKLQITGIAGDSKLNEVIDWSIILDGTDYVIDAEHSLAAKTGSSTDADILTVKGHMDENANNDYQGLSISGIGITVIATQDSVEYDSFGNDYDELAEYPAYVFASVERDADGRSVNNTLLYSFEKYGSTDSPLITANVPAGAKLTDDTSGLKLRIEKAANPDGISVEITQNEPKTLDISMEGLAEDNDKLIKVEFYIERGLSLVEINHNGRKMNRCGGLRWVDEDQEFYYDSATGLITMLTKTFSPFTYTSDKNYWDNKKAAEYKTPVDNTNKVITVASAEELALFKYEITDKKVNYTGYTLNITSDIDLGANYWRPINPIDNMTINGNGHTISNLLVRSYTSPSGYGYGFIANSKGRAVIRDITFKNADVACLKGTVYYGNVGSVVMAYAYGTTEFNNVSVINSSLNGYGKIGMLLGMGADPGVKVSFKNCVSKDNTIRAVYNMGGLAGNIQRGKDGADNGSVENCVVENINLICDKRESYADLNVTAKFKSNDRNSGTDVLKAVSGKYWIYQNYYWGGYADYYVSYGSSEYDAVIDENSMCFANSEYCVNK